MIRRGMTLVEMMVALTATLLLMAAVAQVFSAFGTAVSDSRSVMELDSRMRAAAWRLRSDLEGATAPMLPPLRPDQDAGYFEIVEGPNSDTLIAFDPATATTIAGGFDKTGAAPGPATSDDRILGDTDDVLLFTTRDRARPFLGRFDTGKYESQLAEVAWFLRPARVGGTVATSDPTTFTLYRRQLLVVGYVGSGTFARNRNMVDAATLPGAGTAWQKYYDRFDISARAVTSNSGTTFIPNTLSDLTRRESRFMHNVAGISDGSGFPYPFPAVFQQAAAAPVLYGLTFEGTGRQGEDVVLGNVIGFDVRVFDPTAPAKVSGDTILGPGDPGFATAAGGVANGAYVDLGNGVTTRGPSGQPPRLAGYGSERSQLQGSATAVRVWDTWSTHYESDGFDQDRDGMIDQGTNGFDDNANGIVDDGPIDINQDGLYNRPNELGEQETWPPYPVPMRGIEVRLRCYEPSSRQVRQITIRHSFVP
jgi:prepilin-type N-terminal cleavage/methylation domain-containing protein